MKHGVIFLSSTVLVALLVAPLMAWADANPDFDEDAKPILKMQPGLLRYVESRFDVRDTGTAKYPGDDDRRPTPPYIFRARPIGSSGPYNLRLLIQPGEPGHILGVVDITRVRLNGPAVANRPPSENQPPPQQPYPQQPYPPEPPPQEAQQQEPPPQQFAPQQPPQESPQVSQGPSVQVPELSAPPQNAPPDYQVIHPPSQQQPQPAEPSGSGPVQAPSEPTADTPSGPIMGSGSTGSSSSNSNQPALAPPPDPAPNAQ